jgi:uncharacterized protein (DUF885 family)
MLSRRDLLASASAAAFLPVLPAYSADMQPSDPANRLNKLMEVFFLEDLNINPESATLLGLDKGEHADLKHRLSDQSAAGIAARRALNADQLLRLKSIDPSTLRGMDRVNYDTLLYTRERSAEIMAFDFGGTAFGPSPYVVSQLTGAYQSVPDFLDTKHRVDNASDADAYLARLEAFAAEIDANTDRMKHDAAMGVVPPDFILDTALKQMTATSTTPDKARVVTSLARRAKERNLDASYAEKAGRIYSDKIAPALGRQMEETRKLRASAVHDAGVWRLKQGEPFYAATLHSSTTTKMIPDEIHQLGIDQGAAITARLDVLLNGLGMTKGTVGERIAALYKDPQYFYPNTDAGKAQAIAYCNTQLAAIRPRLPAYFKRLPPYSFEVRRVPPETEPGAASAFSQPPALDGSRPGIVYFNLHDSAEWPKFALSTTVFHEALPGHQLEGGLALSNKNLPLLRKTIGFSSYAEGWALYAEQLADEMGMYEHDPMGRIGYLKFQLFRANRCIVDTGIHHMRWSREKAIQHFIDSDGDAPGFAAREVERYCTNPGQACSYKIGHTVWTRARERARAALAGRYDIKDFHAAGLDCGRVPLDVLDAVIDRYISEAKA